MYQERYPEIDKSKWVCISNGYDEESFSRAEKRVTVRDGSTQKLVLIHSGILYPFERNPEWLFQAIASLKHKNIIKEDNFSILLRATAHDDEIQEMIDKADIGDIVSIKPGIPYDEALAEMLSADGLLLLQASNCNHQIPAKVYEYIRARRPVFALTDAIGDTAGVLREAGINSIVPLDDVDQIEQGLIQFLDQIRAQRYPVTPANIVESYSRQSQTHLLTSLFKQIATEK
jgi:glycosyltransferase involved in cell wall biosynthesis